MTYLSECGYKDEEEIAMLSHQHHRHCFLKIKEEKVDFVIKHNVDNDTKETTEQQQQSVQRSGLKNAI